MTDRIHVVLATEAISRSRCRCPPSRLRLLNANTYEIQLKENGDFLGNGNIDFARIKGLLRSIKYTGWLIIEGSTLKGNAVTHFNSVFCGVLT